MDAFCHGNPSDWITFLSGNPSVSFWSNTSRCNHWDFRNDHEWRRWKIYRYIDGTHAVIFRTVWRTLHFLHQSCFKLLVSNDKSNFCLDGNNDSGVLPVSWINWSRLMVDYVWLIQPDVVKLTLLPDDYGIRIIKGHSIMLKRLRKWSSIIACLLDEYIW